MAYLLLSLLVYHLVFRFSFLQAWAFEKTVFEIADVEVTLFVWDSAIPGAAIMIEVAPVCAVGLSFNAVALAEIIWKYSLKYRFPTAILEYFDGGCPVELVVAPMTLY